MYRKDRLFRARCCTAVQGRHGGRVRQARGGRPGGGVRPVRPDERVRWDEQMREHHYLGFRQFAGLRQVAVWRGRWLALLGWQSGAFKCAARDRWLGWHPSVQFRRLHLIAHNTRFLVLPEATGIRRAGVARAVARPAAAERGLEGGARPSAGDRGDVRGSGAVPGHVLPGVELGGGGRSTASHATSSQPRNTSARPTCRTVGWCRPGPRPRCTGAAASSPPPAAARSTPGWRLGPGRAHG